MENQVASPIPASVSASLGDLKKRQYPRYLSGARVVIFSGIRRLVENAVLKDIGLGGCCLILGEQEDEAVKRHGIYVIYVIPENEQIERFKLFVHCRWIRSRSGSREIGFSIISSPSVYRQYKYHCQKKRV